jgi:uncharacterized SAM-binding protein YcdF (DUF218 family)
MPYFLFSPITWALLLALALLLSWRRLSRAWRTAGVVAGVLLLVLCMPFGANLLERVVEGLAPAPTHCTQRDTGPIVLLSGGFEHAPRDADDYAAFTPETWNRVRAAADVWRRSGKGELWITGGGPYRFKESALQARLASDWDVPVSALRIETQSTTTWESAFALKPALSGQKLRLVTSPAHRARALFAFEAAGFEACVQDTGSDVIAFGSLGYLLPQVSAIEKSENAIYELVGIAYYRIRKLRGTDTAARPPR